MGQYLNPPLKIKEIAREIHGSNYQELTSNLREGEKLFGLYDRYIFQQTPYLFSENEYNEFSKQVSNGIIRKLGMYAMSNDEFEKQFGVEKGE